MKITFSPIRKSEVGESSFDIYIDERLWGVCCLLQSRSRAKPTAATAWLHRPEWRSGVIDTSRSAAGLSYPQRAMFNIARTPDEIKTRLLDYAKRNPQNKAHLMIDDSPTRRACVRTPALLPGHFA